ncbi:hypothetical protein SERLADRAFT_373390 [Serpula lacrymans var. lacrymans S7.9]|uniref:Uncharacterized protein n=1 Tax=Serpula lacrymans var. lacrymans (strain S7.9) TaxID=578457 RepID=F8P850_SERL9|nr:uncharacterized protein SERLADRAFT_373390 [Serpula lacrymans var. lacrymans S7.9]EGO20607.1 hypothetical protein SERLADRAFT_373390 [Serpula lacrymans var. lacrymans S7.9]
MCKPCGQISVWLPLANKRKLVQDPLNHCGRCIICEVIVAEIDCVAEKMLLHEPDDFAQHKPKGKKIGLQALVYLGLHHRWSSDGHNKLILIGFPIWGLGLWVVPNNRLKTTIGYLYLSLVYELKVANPKIGMSLHNMIDCGSETTEMYKYTNALPEYFSPYLSPDKIPAHRFLKSVHNITI